MTHEDINRQPFIEEAQDLLSELQDALLELEASPEDKDLIDRVFRAMHTIKGSGAMFGFDAIATFTHEVETVFDKVREGQMGVDLELLNLTLAARDHIAALLEAEVEGLPVDAAAGDSIVEGLRNLAGENASAPAQAAAKPASARQNGTEPVNQAELFRVRFEPAQDIFLSGTNPGGLLRELAGLAEPDSFRVFAHTDRLPEASSMNPESCYLYWDVILKTKRGVEAIRDVFIFVEDDCKVEVDLLAGDSEADGRDILRLGEILTQRGDVNAAELSGILQAQPRLGQMLTERGVVAPSKVASALAEQEAVRKVASQKKQEEVTMSIRVGADKLDQLVNLVGELVIVQARLSQEVSTRSDPILSTLAEELERLSDELRDSALSVRMLPIGTTFNKFRRLVRDLSAELGKEIELETEGAETELDKTVIERLNDPLVHLLRNSIDHGIENPEVRTAAGKSAKGTIRLVAEHSGGEVHLRIQDNGGGINTKKVLEKALERELISPEAAESMSDKEIFNLIFAAGFSTADQVSSVSGRGVGMDVVKSSIEALRGSIDIESVQGQGTTLTIKLPLTLAIIDGLQVQVQDEHYVIPLPLVEECVELSNEQQNGQRKQQLLHLRGEIVPYIRIREWFQTPGQSPDIEQVVITSVAGTRVGIVVDNVIGEHQTVIKSLGRIYRDVEGISGATIKGDGSMALILDVPRLVRSATEVASAA